MTEKINGDGQKQKRVLIIGGGFGGIAAALTLAKHCGAETKITLVSDKPHFEYKPALYRVVTGRSPLEVCVPLTEIFGARNKNIELLNETVVQIDQEKQTALGASGAAYEFDCLVLALGSEPAFFDIPGLEDFSFGFTTIAEALRLRKHLHDLFRTCRDAQTSQDEGAKICLMHFVIVGAGPSGVELAGELAVFTKQLAKKHRIDPSLITIDLVEAAHRILPALPERVARRVARRLRYLGINIFLNRPMTKENCEEIIVRGLTMKTSTVIWTAGVKPNSFYQKIPGLEFDEKGRVLVNEYLQAKNCQNIFVIGDGAATRYSGMAQTAAHDGRLAAANIARRLAGRPLLKYREKQPYYSLPVGPRWAATMLRSLTLYGRAGWGLRRLADLRYFFSILPIGKAITAFRTNQTMSQTCNICAPKNKNETVND